jgi:LTXXQ motif family protein
MQGEFPMNRSMIAGIALAAGVAIAAPALVSAAEEQPQLTQAEPEQHGMEGMRGMMGGGMRGMMGGGREGMGHHGWMHEMMQRRSPRERCEERLAHRAGIIAYTVSKLNLTAEQKPLWDKLNGVIQSAGDKERQLCASLPAQAGPQGQTTILDRMSRREQFLSARLQSLQQARPALEALYQALTPEQKAIIDHPFRR